MWFGYLNRNYDETPNIVIGDNNTFFAADGVDSAGPLDPNLFLADPGPADREVSPLTFILVVSNLFLGCGTCLIFLVRVGMVG